MELIFCMTALFIIIFYRSMGESGQAFSSNHRNSDRSDRITDLWTDRIYAASIGDRFRSFNLLE